MTKYVLLVVISADYPRLIDLEARNAVRVEIFLAASYQVALERDA